MREAARYELAVEDYVAGRALRDGGAYDAHRGLCYRQREKSERQQRERVEGYPLADAENRKPREERPPERGQRLRQPAVGVDVAAPEDEYEYEADYADLGGVAKALRRRENDRRDHRPADGQQKPAKPRNLVDLLKEYREDADPQRADGYRDEVRKIVILSVRKLDERYARPEERKDEADEKVQKAQIFAARRALAEAYARRRDARGYRYAQRAVGHPDAAYRPRAHEGDVLEVVILVALKVFFEKFLYKHAYDGYYRNNRRRAQIRIRKHKAPLPQKLNKTNKAAVTLRYPLLSYHKKRKPQDGFAPRRLPRQSIFSDALKA